MDTASYLLRRYVHATNPKDAATKLWYKMAVMIGSVTVPNIWSSKKYDWAKNNGMENIMGYKTS